MARKTGHPLIKGVSFVPTGETATALDQIRAKKAAKAAATITDGTKTMGPARNTYSAEEVIEFRDTDHTPYNKRPGSVKSQVVVQVRRPENLEHRNWVNFTVEETTTTDPHGRVSAGRTQTRTISYSMPRAMFEAMVAHVNKGTN